MQTVLLPVIIFAIGLLSADMFLRAWKATLKALAATVLLQNRQITREVFRFRAYNSLLRASFFGLAFCMVIFAYSKILPFSTSDNIYMLFVLACAMRLTFFITSIGLEIRRMFRS